MENANAGSNLWGEKGRKPQISKLGASPEYARSDFLHQTV